jgi:hypothetical protein
MVSRRVFKQASVVAAGLILLFAVLTGLFFLVVHPRSSSVATPSPSPSFAPITVEKVYVIPHAPATPIDPSTVDIVAQVRNSNPTVGVAQYPVTFIVHDKSGNVVATDQETTYMLPSSLRYIAAFNVTAGRGSLGNVEVQLPQAPVYTAVPNGIKMPEFNVFLKDISRHALGSKQIEDQRGIIRNVGTLDWERVEVTAVALSADNQVIGVGKTFVGALKNTEEREFSLQWPVPSVPTSRVIAIPSTNIFAEDNFRSVIGDPNSLR